MDLSFSTDTGAASREPGGQDVTIHLTAAEATALGLTVAPLYDWFVNALRALVAMRTGYLGGDPARGEPGLAFWSTVINDLDARLVPHLEGIRAAAIRGFTGSHQQLADAMAVTSRQTAADRRHAITCRPTTNLERWATIHPDHRAGDAPQFQPGTWWTRPETQPE